MKTLATLTSLVVLSLAGVSAQRPADAPPTGPAGKAPDTVFLEDLTWAEARDLVKAGTTTVIIGTAGTEQKGPHMVDGEHKFVLEYAADKIARGLGKTLVAPDHYVCARRQLGSAERSYGQAWHHHAPGRSFRGTARQCRPEPQVRRI